MWNSQLNEWATVAKHRHKTLVVLDFDAPACLNNYKSHKKTGMLHVVATNNLDTGKCTMRPPCPPHGATHTYHAFLTTDETTIDFKDNQMCVELPSDAEHIGSQTFQRPHRCQPKQIC